MDLWIERRVWVEGYPRLWIAASGTVLSAVTEERKGKRFEKSCYVKLKLMTWYLWRDFNSDRIWWSRGTLLRVTRTKIWIEFMFSNWLWAAKVDSSFLIGEGGESIWDALVEKLIWKTCHSPHHSWHVTRYGVVWCGSCNTENDDHGAAVDTCMLLQLQRVVSQSVAALENIDAGCRSNSIQSPVLSLGRGEGSCGSAFFSLYQFFIFLLNIIAEPNVYVISSLALYI